ncbi:hypothetical protein [Nitrospirillum viridazoti]|uniref:Uncharacterized protein n=1 Tax=Nitrospirillum amazonense TaxID=28077 RepID=A0A560J5D1_9PROT|nr:hypothetical protein [Nitrospirillum amazonense]TWB64444.1 hypothetical protein FBZ92_101340 [Nitrospirillum amazonense]
MSRLSGIQAFGGDPAVKARMLERVRVRWRARALVPDTSLNWKCNGLPDSLSGALAETQDRGTFEERTGIPVDLALLCEALIAPGIKKASAGDAATGASIEGAEHVLSFGLEWLDAIRPGAELDRVGAQFARYCLEMLLQPDFALAPYISAEFRAVGLRIAALWDRELAGETTARDGWRGVRKAALAANADETPVWGYRVATLLEAVAWPIQSISGEFVGVFAAFLFNWLMFLETAHMTEQERSDREHMLIGWRAMAIAPRDEAGNIDVDPLEFLPESQRVMSMDYVTRTMERTMAVRDAARGQKEQAIRGLMDTILGLIRKA